MSSKTPLVSVGLPAYNEEKYIRKTILSLLEQTYNNLEIIISDNASTDSTVKLIKETVTNDARCKIVVQKENIGVVENFRFVRNSATGDYFMWLGGHDILDKGFIERAVNFLRINKDYVLFYPKAIYMDINNNKIELTENPIETSSENPRERACFVFQTLNVGTPIHGLFNSEFIKKMPLNDHGCDDMLILYLAAIEGKIKVTDSFDYIRNKYRIETEEEIEKRYSSYGYKTHLKGFNLSNLIGLYHLLFTLKSSHLSNTDKFTIMKLIIRKYYFINLSTYSKFCLSVEKRFDYFLQGLFFFLLKRFQR